MAKATKPESFTRAKEGVRGPGPNEDEHSVRVAVSAAAGHHQEQVLFAGAGRAVIAHAQYDAVEDDPRVIRVRFHR